MFVCLLFAKISTTLKRFLKTIQRFVNTIFSLHRELSPTRTLKSPGYDRVQITCNTLGACHVQHVVCHVARRNNSAIREPQFHRSAASMFGVAFRASGVSRHSHVTKDERKRPNWKIEISCVVRDSTEEFSPCLIRSFSLDACSLLLRSLCGYVKFHVRAHSGRLKNKQETPPPPPPHHRCVRWLLCFCSV